jgi:DNA-binding NarL/FixJ family response regulator
MNALAMAAEWFYRMRPAQRPISVMIADDHPLLRQALRAVVDLEPDMHVVAEASDGGEAIRCFERFLPDLSLVDIQMPQVDGLQAIRAMRKMQVDARILVLTSFAGDARIERAMVLGAAAYVLKTTSGPALIRSMRRTLCGHSSIEAQHAREVAQLGPTECLSAREVNALHLVAAGLGNREIGEALHVSEETVKTRVKSILAKLGARDRTHAVSIAVRRGYIDT